MLRITHSAEQEEQFGSAGGIPLFELVFDLLFFRQNLFFTLIIARVIAEPKIMYVIIS